MNMIVVVVVIITNSSNSNSNHHNRSDRTDSNNKWVVAIARVVIVTGLADRPGRQIVTYYIMISIIITISIMVIICIIIDRPGPDPLLGRSAQGGK